MISGVDARNSGAAATKVLKCSLLTCSPPASPSRNPSTNTYSDGFSRLRDHSKNKLPGSARVALVKSATSFGKSSTCSGFGVHFTTMKITVNHCSLRDEDGSATDVTVVEIADG